MRWALRHCQFYPQWMRIMDFVSNETEFSALHGHKWQKEKGGPACLPWERKKTHWLLLYQFCCLVIYSGWQKYIVEMYFVRLERNVLTVHKEGEFHTWLLQQWGLALWTSRAGCIWYVLEACTDPQGADMWRVLSSLASVLVCVCVV